MTSRERVRAALRHTEPDRVPIDLGGNQTGITRTAYEGLLTLWGWDESIEILDAIQQLAQPSARALDRLGVDTRYIRARGAEGSDGGTIEELIRGKPHLSFTDEFGVTWSMPKENGLYHDITFSPLAGATTVADIESHPWPNGGDPTRFRGVREEALRTLESTDKALLTGISGVVFEFGWYLMSFEHFYRCLATQPELIEAILDHTLQYWLDFEAGFLDAVGDLVDVVCVGDDLAGQHGMLMSPETYRRFIKPRQAKLYALIHSKTRAKLWYHSCGGIGPVIPDLIEIGVEVLNPVQVSATGMDPAGLKREYGRDLVFWGGGCDTQHVLPHGTPADVAAEVKQRLDALAPGGGCVFTPVHNIQPDVPAANVVAMYEAAAEWRG